MNDDLRDAAAYAMKHTGSVIGQMSGRAVMIGIDESTRILSQKSAAINKVWAKQLAAQINKASIFGTLFNAQTMPGAAWRKHNCMRHALKVTGSKHLAAFNQMNPARKDSFIQRVERHGKKQYPNQQHMRDLLAHYISERVTDELKD